MEYEQHLKIITSFFKFKTEESALQVIARGLSFRDRKIETLEKLLTEAEIDF
jgi:hypothetical protein